MVASESMQIDEEGRERLKGQNGNYPLQLAERFSLDSPHRLSWMHAVNGDNLLRSALKNPYVHFLEADVAYGWSVANKRQGDSGAVSVGRNMLCVRTVKDRGRRPPALQVEGSSFLDVRPSTQYRVGTLWHAFREEDAVVNSKKATSSSQPAEAENRAHSFPKTDTALGAIAEEKIISGMPESKHPLASATVKTFYTPEEVPPWWNHKSGRAATAHAAWRDEHGETDEEKQNSRGIRERHPSASSTTYTVSGDSETIAEDNSNSSVLLTCEKQHPSASLMAEHPSTSSTLMGNAKTAEDKENGEFSPERLQKVLDSSDRRRRAPLELGLSEDKHPTMSPMDESTSSTAQDILPQDDHLSQSSSAEYCPDLASDQGNAQGPSASPPCRCNDPVKADLSNSSSIDSTSLLSPRSASSKMDVPKPPPSNTPATIVMAHYPTQQSSDLGFKEFIDTILRHNEFSRADAQKDGTTSASDVVMETNGADDVNAARTTMPLQIKKFKGVKLDFKLLECVRPALVYLREVDADRRFEGHLWLNADVLSGPGALTQPLDAVQFLRLCLEFQPSAVLSLGWGSTIVSVTRVYTEDMVNEMVELCTRPSIPRSPQEDMEVPEFRAPYEVATHITFAVSFEYAMASVTELKGLLDRVPGSSLTLFCGMGSFGVTRQQKHEALKAFDVSRLFLDLKDIRQSRACTVDACSAM